MRAAEGERLSAVNAERERLRQSVESDLRLMGERAEALRRSLDD